MKIQAKNQRISGSMLISLTDVIFLLLIFLMLTSNFVTQTGIHIKLPGAKTSTAQASKTLDIIYVNAQEIYLNNIKMDIQTFQQLIPDYFRSKDQSVRLLADKNTPLQEAVGLMDIIRNAGFEKITIATQKVNE